MTKTDQLPKLASDLIELALNDLEKCEADPRYQINMGTWHKPIKGSEAVCAVCFAGAVMAQTNMVDINENHNGSALSDADEDRIDALNEFRCGYIREGLDRMGLTINDGVPDDFDAADYRVYPAKFKAEMKALASDLRQAGR